MKPPKDFLQKHFSRFLPLVKIYHAPKLPYPTLFLSSTMQSKATTVAQYLAELPADRRAAIAQVRQVILKNIDKTYEEGMQYGMIGYYVPHAVFPPGYHCDPKQPLPFLALASQKNHMAVYMMCLYDGSVDQDRFRKEWEATEKKLDMGKSCIRFKRVEDLCLDLIGAAIKRVPAAKYIAFYQKIRAAEANRKAGSSAAKKTAPAKKTAVKKSAAPTGSAAKKVSKTVKKAKTAKK